MNKNYIIFYVCLLVNSIFVASEKNEYRLHLSDSYKGYIEGYIKRFSHAETDLEKWIERRDEVDGKHEKTCIDAFVHGSVEVPVDLKVSDNLESKKLDNSAYEVIIDGTVDSSKVNQISVNSQKADDNLTNLVTSEKNQNQVNLSDNYARYINPNSPAAKDLAKWIERKDKVYGKHEKTCMAAFVHGSVDVPVDLKVSEKNEVKK